MKNIKYIFPNALTLINLLLGCVAITVVFKAQNEYNAAWLIIFAAIADLLDGMVARLLNAKSAFGAQLDSLADMVSFGVAPALIIFNWFNLILIEMSTGSNFDLTSAGFPQNIVLLCSLFFAAAAGLRLAKFNTTPQSDHTFKGLTTTAAGLIIASLWLLINTENEFVRSIILNIYFALFLLAVLIMLMLSNIPMLSLKFHGISLKNNFDRYIIIVISSLLILFFRVEGIFFSLAFYVLFSLLINFLRKRETA
ncbi:MAG: CDP-alcohol phosphatidyltransferase family protein [Bacteroidales bacterium]|nr:CDP-alcohol phosphatidyltransferase family protein [Bacteroidales bacterium]